MIPVSSTLIQSVSTTYSLDPKLLLGQIQTESGGDPNAFRYEAAYFDKYIRTNPRARGAAYGPLAACSFGLLQIMLETALEGGFTGRPEQLFVPATGLACGALYLKELLAWANGNYPKALAAYNEGKGNAAIGPPFIDQAYVDRVYQYANITL